MLDAPEDHHLSVQGGYEDGMTLDEQDHLATDEDHEAMLLHMGKRKGNSRYRNNLPIADD